MKRANFMMFEGDYHRILEDEDWGYGMYHSPSSRIVTPTVEQNALLLKVLRLKVTGVERYDHFPEINFVGGFNVEYYTGRMKTVGGAPIDFASRIRLRKNREEIFCWENSSLPQHLPPAGVKDLLWKLHLRYLKGNVTNPCPEFTDIVVGDCVNCGTTIYVPKDDEIFDGTHYQCTGCGSVGKSVAFLHGNKVRVR